MVETVDPQQAQTLIASGAVEVIDVRESAEWSRGHVPGARNVPMGDIVANPREQVTRDGVLFVCARGVRSMTAAQAVAQSGRTQLYTLAGGTQAWEAAGIAVVTEAPVATPKPAAPVAAESDGQDDASCGLPEPALDAIVGTNVRLLRDQRGITLDALARMTGLSRTLLGQIENGRAAPSVSVVWRLARAFDVHFSALLATSERVATSVLRESKAKRLVSPDGRFSSRALYNLSEKNNVEFYELRLSAHSREDAEPHQPGTRENLIVTAGKLALDVGDEHFDLATGDAIVFTADVRHAYVNPGADECVMYLVMTYTTARS